MSEVLDLKTIGSRVRTSRQERGLKSLEDFADRVGDLCGERPSVAKLSRIEAGVQAIPTDILPAVVKITAIPAPELRPDLAELLYPSEAAE
jgi:transcriptional regulator with XRE-family HTH domain